MSARPDAFTVSGPPDVDRGLPQLGVALSFAVTCASRAAAVAVGSWYVRDAAGLLLGRVDRAGGEILVWRFDPRPGDVRDRQLAVADARLLEAGPAGPGVQRTEVIMATRTRTNTKRGVPSRSSTRKKSAAAKSASRKSSSVKASRTPARTTATSSGEKKMTAAQAQAVSILTKNGGEMKVSELAAAVVASGRVKLGGKTPAATVGSQIYTAAKAGRLFRKTKRGHVALRAGAAS